MIEEYTIKQLLDTYTLFVPEIQRDYVWGAAENYNDVLLPFVQALNYNLKGNKKNNIGFLYSYANTKTENYIIDGQQRFTTIVLLLYVLSVRERVDFTNYLRVNEPTMRFSYNVRPQTETFMRRLFESGKVSKEEITLQNWFMPTYFTDTSITSMLNAVNQLNTALDNLSEITFEKVLNQVCFWYFNVEETSQGEELYITMNSRGQKLTESEQIKPHLFDKWQKTQSEDKTDYGKLWDKWEEEFYSKKGKEHGIASVDIAMNTFLRVVYEMKTGEECRNGIPARNEILDLPLIARYMTSMQGFASEVWPNLLAEKIDSSTILLLQAMIAEGLKPIKTPGDKDRVKRIFSNILRRRKQYSHKEMLSFLHSYSLSTESFYNFVLNSQSPIFDEHELDKIKIYKHFENTLPLQKQIEETFASAEVLKVCCGNISPLIRWSLNDETDLFSIDINKFEYYYCKFNSLFGDARLKETDMDITRRALLTRELHDYPRIFKGYTNTSFAFEPQDWNALFFDEQNIPKLKEFLDIYNGEKSLENMINSYPQESNYSEFVHIPELMKYCEQKRFQWKWGTIYLISASTANSEHANIHTYKYYLSKKNNLNFDSWSNLNFWHYGISCVYMDFNSMNIAFDAMWNSGPNNNQLGIEVFSRQNEEKDTENILKPILELEGYGWNGKRYAHYFDCPEDEQKAFSLMDEKIKILVDFINNKFSSSQDASLHL